MAWNRNGLGRRLYDPRNTLPVTLPDAQLDLRDALGRVDRTPDGVLWLKLARTRHRLQIGEAHFDKLADHKEGLWSVCAASETGVGTASPFDPSTRLTLAARLPIRVPEGLDERLQEVGLRMPADLAEDGCVRAGGRRFAVLGMRTVGALDQKDAARITWWLPTRGALELILVEEGGQCWLQIVDLVQERDADRALNGPNVLLRLAADAALPIGPPPGEDAAPGSVATSLRIDPSPVLEAWVRYGAAKQELLADRQKAREGSPLVFTEGQQRGKSWRIQCRLEEAGLHAWLGADAVDGRRVRVDQSVRLDGGENEDQTWTVETMTLTGVSMVRAEVRSANGRGRLPERGQLLAVEDKGATTARKRERDGMERLTSGRAAQPRLPYLLRDPGQVARPRPVTLRSTSTHLDADQRRAVELIVGCEDLVAIQGPPGTGKTRVIVEALQQILAIDRDPDVPVRVLVSSVQNEAVGNVVERLHGTDGLLIRQDQRRGKDDDEATAFAKVREEGRQQVLDKLEARLAGFDQRAPFGEIEELRRRVGSLKSHAMASRDPEIIAGLRSFAEGSDPRVLSRRREEAAALADRIEAAAAAGLGDAETGDMPPAASAGGIPPAPRSPEEVAGWWAVAKPHVALAMQPEIAMAVEAVDRVLAMSEGPRRERRMGKALAGFHAAVADLPSAAPGVTGEAPSPAGPDLPELRGRANAWAMQLDRDLRAQEDDLLRDPRAIALRFLEDLRADAQAWHRIVEDHADTVAATCSRSARVELPPGDDYDWVIIDEAGRASPFELLIPLVQGKRIVLIGDHRQLPPMVEDALAEAADANARIDISQDTLFGELMRRLPPANRVRLGTQYRMHGDIGDLVDQCFYRPKDEALSSHFVGPRAAEKTPQWGVREDRPLVWEEVARSGEPCRERNDREIERIIELLEEFADAGAPADAVAVICPYRKQRLALEQRLGRHPNAARVAQVRTIDQVQGREYETVILTLVRTDGSPGFMASPNRINVALSRAQKQLIVVGSAAAFLESKRVKRRARHLVQAIQHIHAATEVSP